jgi:hypothetical protein
MFIFAKIKKNNMAENIKRNKKILKSLLKGEKLTVIGEKFGVTKQRIRQIGEVNGYSRLETIRTKREELGNSMIKDINNSMSVKKLTKKYKVDEQTLRAAYKSVTGDTPHSALRKLRNVRLSNDFMNGDTASKIITKTSKKYVTPVKISTLDGIYAINTMMGVKRYPMITDRSKGSLNLSKRVSNMIINRANKGYTFARISDELNDLNYTTITGVKFTEANTYSIYRAILNSKK